MGGRGQVGREKMQSRAVGCGWVDGECGWIAVGRRTASEWLGKQWVFRWAEAAAGHGQLNL